MPESINYEQEEAAAREEAQEYATQQAFLLLLSRQLNEYQHLGEILRKTTEQAIDFVQASGGEVWLLQPSGKLALSFSTLPLFHNEERETWKNVPAKWAINRKQAFRTSDSLHDPRLATLGAKSLRDVPPTLISVPLIVREKVIGAMTLYNLKSRPFSQKDEVLVQSVADLASPVIANVLTRQKTEQYANQQKALFEMSLQIAGNLDLQTTLDRALQWVDRIATVEIGLLWLANEAADMLHCSAVLGIPTASIGELPAFPVASDNLVCTVLADKKLTVLDPWKNETPFHLAMSAALRTPIRNMIAIPMFNRERPLGVICLFNHVGGAFAETDMTMLSIAAQMIGVVISNAQLYNHSLALTSEREQYYKVAIQRERLAAIGRLMSSLSHEINNPLQAVRGALALAVEDINEPEELKIYFGIMQREIVRVVQLLARMRQIYRPSAEGMQQLDVNRVLLETFALTNKELSRHNTSIENNLAIQVPPVTGEASQIHLAFLNILLSLGDAIGAAGGGVLDVATRANRPNVEIVFSTETNIPQWEQIFDTATSHIQTGTGFSLLLSREIILAHEGQLNLEQDDARTLLTVSLPLHERHYPHTSRGA